MAPATNFPLGGKVIVWAAEPESRAPNPSSGQGAGQLPPPEVRGMGVPNPWEMRASTLANRANWRAWWLAHCALSVGTAGIGGAARIPRGACQELHAHVCSDVTELPPLGKPRQCTTRRPKGGGLVQGLTPHARPPSPRPGLDFTRWLPRTGSGHQGRQAQGRSQDVASQSARTGKVLRQRGQDCPVPQ